MPGVVDYTYTLSIQEVDVGASEVQGQCGQHSENLSQKKKKKGGVMNLV
jgi:hypothetical protein